MQSLQIRLTPELLKRVDNMVKTGMYSNRNEAIRDAVRRLSVEYETLGRTQVLREKIAPKLRGKSTEQIIRSVREEGDE
jgi:putative addiction module CopG family antidote